MGSCARSHGLHEFLAIIASPVRYPRLVGLLTSFISFDEFPLRPQHQERVLQHQVASGTHVRIVLPILCDRLAVAMNRIASGNTKEQIIALAGRQRCREPADELKQSPALAAIPAFRAAASPRFCCRISATPKCSAATCAPSSVEPSSTTITSRRP